MLDCNMHLSLPSLSRRKFRMASVAAAEGCSLGARLRGDVAEASPNRFVLFSDTHIAGDREAVTRGTNMFNNLAQACREVQELAPKPTAVFVDGDLALTIGTSEDYATFVASVEP